MQKALTLFLFFISLGLFAQNDTVIFTTQGHFYYDQIPLWAVYSPLIDRMGRPYVFTASVELGMVTFDINNLMAPVPVDTITPAMLNGANASFLAQSGNLLFIATGNLQAAGERGGLSIYDVTNPLQPVLKDHWDSAAYTHGAAQVLIEGNYAYLAALDDGVIILNISDVNNIQFVSRFLPTTISCQNANHARGLFYSGDTLLVANDCGGLRVLNVTNKSNPLQMGAYLNTTSYGTGTPYYNHVVRIGDYAFIPVDYCGFEVDNVANPATITNTAVWNPWNCASNNWVGADLHTNEIVSAMPAANVLMVSGADSQVLAFDPANPAQPRLMGAWGQPNTDSLAAWGVDVFGGLVALGYLRTPFPYFSDHGGLQLLTWTLVTGVNENEFQTGKLNLYPNPANEKCTITLPGSSDKNFTIEMLDMMGRIVKLETADPKLNGRNFEIDLAALNPGMYSVRVSGNNLIYTGRIVKK